MTRRSLGLLGFLWLAACGGDAPPPARTVTPLDSSATGTIHGTVRFEGAIPPPREVRMSGECAALHTGPVTVHDVRVADGNLADAFVWIRDGLGDRGFAMPTGPVAVDQRGCLYAPRVVGARVGQEIQFVNSDAFLHNVHGTPKAQSGWNFGMAMKGQTRAIRLNAAEVPVSVRCDVHPWMQAWVGVVDHPYFAVTGTDGRFSLTDVPAGHYIVTAWHEKLGTRDVTIDVAAKGTVDTGFIFAPAEGAKN